MTGVSIDQRRLERVWRCFDATGRLQRWPARRAEQVLALWIVWSQLPQDRRYTEPEINTMLGGWHDLGDHALLRRDLIDMGLLRRTTDGAICRVAQAEPPPDAAAAMSRFAAG